MKVFGEKFYRKTPKDVSISPKRWEWKPRHLSWFKNPKPFLIKKEFEVFFPKKIRHGYTLVISHKDVQTGALLKTLREQKKPFVFICWDHFILKGSLRFDLKKNLYFLKYGKTSVDLSMAKSIFFYPPDVVESQLDTSSYFSFSEKLFINRWAEPLLNLEGILTQAKWFPATPSKLMCLSQKKMADLKLAKTLGFDVPATIITSSAEDVRRFMNRYGQVILREFGRRVFLDRKNNFRHLEISMVGPHDRDLGLVENAPCVFQEYIEKEFEVRAVVLGDAIFAAKILINDGLDWRGHEGRTPFVKFNLSEKIQARLKRFMKAQGFAFASFDLIKGKNGKFYFLEMNRPGNWFFIEALTGLKIRAALVKLF